MTEIYLHFTMRVFTYLAHRPLEEPERALLLGLAEAVEEEAGVAARVRMLRQRGPGLLRQQRRVQRPQLRPVSTYSVT